ncbi:MAG: tripartite tricarboxylate transporter permease, partial [Pseudomonadota bacterium]
IDIDVRVFHGLSIRRRHLHAGRRIDQETGAVEKVETVSVAIDGLWQIAAGGPLFAVLVGLIIGVVVGVLPGLGPLLGVTLAIPFTFSMDPVTGVALLMGIYQGGSYGGALTAIILGIPGTPIAAATLLDGRPMAQRGEASMAVSLATLASWFGGCLGGLSLLLFAPYLAEFALDFGPAEIFCLALLGLTAIATLSEESAVKGLLAGVFGLLFAAIGTDPYTGISRFNFGITELSGGITFVALLVGLFAIPEVLAQLERPFSNTRSSILISFKFQAFRTVIGKFFTYARSSLVGVTVGAVPGIGGVVSSFLSYKLTRDLAKDKSRFGKGEPDGVIATEAANSATTGGALIPMLSLGIPGDPIVAVMMGGLLVHGITPGPALFLTSGDVVAGIFAAFLVGAILLLPLAILLVPIFVQILKIPNRLLLVVVLFLAIYGTYAVHGRMFDLWTMLAFGALGYFFVRTRIPRAPLIIGFVLGPVVEVNLRRMSSLASHDPVGYLLSRPVSMVILTIALLFLFYPIIARYRSHATAAKRTQ